MKSGPLLKTAGWALGSYLVAVGIQAGLAVEIEVSARAAALGLAGALYTNIFEYAWHRYGMHGKRPDPRHRTHHQMFHGKSFQRCDAAALREIVTGWYIFPLLLALHYPAFAFLIGPGLEPAFFLGVVLHFLLYEVTHWYAHMPDNAFDRALARIPVLGRLRAVQIHHHRLHHGQPLINCNFNPPYVGDRLAGALRR